MILFPNSDFLNFSSPFTLFPLWLPCSESILLAQPSSHLWQTCHRGAGHRGALVTVSLVMPSCPLVIPERRSREGQEVLSLQPGESPVAASPRQRNLD